MEIEFNGKKFPIADIKSNNGLKREIVDLVLHSPAPDRECELTDFIMALQAILDKHINPETDEGKVGKRTDTQRLNFLQSLNDKSEYTGRCILRMSLTDRGWRLHETSRPGAVEDVRKAIDRFMDKRQTNNGG